MLNDMDIHREHLQKKDVYNMNHLTNDKQKSL